MQRHRSTQVTIGGLFPALIGLWMLAPCPANAELSGTVIWYLEQEAGGEPYRVRYVITSEFMRSDDGRIAMERL